jgi:hypothetical protein
MIFALTDSMNNTDATGAAVALNVLFALGFIAYWVPAAVAIFRKHPQWVAILILNFFGGWTLIGWVIAIVWAFVVPEKAQV